MPDLLPDLWLLALWFLLIFSLKCFPLLVAMRCRPNFVDGSMMYNGLQPAIDTAMLFLIGRGFTPDRQESILHNVFSSSAVMHNTVCESIGMAAIALIELLHSPFSTLADG